jgi:hypothetical protein
VVPPIHIDPEDEPALRSESRVAKPVSSRRRRMEVTSTIGLDRDLELRPSEVQDVVADPVLLMTGEDVTQARGRTDASLGQSLRHSVLASIAINPTRRQKPRWQRTGSHGTESVHSRDVG